LEKSRWSSRLQKKGLQVAEVAIAGHRVAVDMVEDMAAAVDIGGNSTFIHRFQYICNPFWELDHLVERPARREGDQSIT
jgi:hypothetical protein